MAGRARQRREGRDAGFTLIELIVVLAVVAGLSVIAYAAVIPGYARVKAASAPMSARAVMTCEAS